MTHDAVQTRDRSSDGQHIPSLEELNEEYDEEISELSYEIYYSSYLEILQNTDKPVPKEEVYTGVTKEVTERTKEEYLKNLFEMRPGLCEKVSNLNPSAVAFLDRALERTDLEITPEAINRVKEACEDLASDLFDQYIEYQMGHMEQLLEQDMEEPLPEEGEISMDRHRTIIKEYGKIIARELPDELESFDQSKTGIAGRANELITVKSLESIGLQDGTHFKDVSSESASDGHPEDLIVYTEHTDVSPLTVEIKSTANRERGEAGISRIDDPSILFGYFDDQSDLTGNVDKLTEDSIAVYAQPETLDEMASKNQSAYEQTSSSPSTASDGDWLFFRANVVFPEDMNHYYQHGMLPERDLGHEEDYLQTAGESRRSRR